MLDQIYLYIIDGLEVIGAGIIVFGLIKMATVFMTCVFKNIRIKDVVTEIRIEFGNYLILALEVIIGRDILETLLNPTLNDIIILVVLVLLRTLLAFFLDYEITHIQKAKLNKALKKKTLFGKTIK